MQLLKVSSSVVPQRLWVKDQQQLSHSWILWPIHRNCTIEIHMSLNKSYAMHATLHSFAQNSHIPKITMKMRWWDSIHYQSSTRTK